VVEVIKIALCRYLLGPHKRGDRLGRQRRLAAAGLYLPIRGCLAHSGGVACWSACSQNRSMVQGDPSADELVQTRRRMIP